MGLFALLGTILTVVVGAVTNAMNMRNANEQLEKQQQFSHNEAELANQRALENYWNTQSPEARVQQLKDAGLSVGLMYGGSAAGGGVNTGTQAQTPNANLPIMQNPINGNMGDLFENLKKLSESENIGEDTEKKKQEIDKIKSDIDINNATIEQIATENNLTVVLTQNAKIDGTIKQVESEIAENTKQNRIEIVATQLQNMKNEGEKLLKEIEGLKIDNDNKQKMYNATIKKMAAETNLLYQQAIKTQAETWLTKAMTALTTEQTNLTFTERQKTYKEIEQFKNINAKIEAEIKLLEQQEEKIKLEKITEIISWIDEGAQLTDKISKVIFRAAIMPK